MLLACQPDFSVVEPANDGDIRFLLTHNALETQITVAHSGQALQYDLSKAFSASQVTQTWLFTYKRETLITAFPLLATFSNEEIADQLLPTTDDPDGFRPPPADSLYQLSELKDNTTSIQYAPITWTAWEQSSNRNAALRFRFKIDPSIGCPWGPSSLRLFRQFSSNQTCTVNRDAYCRWQMDSCALEDQKRICGEIALSQETVQTARGNLKIGDVECAETPLSSDVFGLSKLWSCEPGVCNDQIVNLAIQEAPPSKATHHTEHQSRFPTSDAVYTGQKDTILTAYNDGDSQIGLRSYRWVRAWLIDVVEQKDLNLPLNNRVVKADYSILRSLQVKPDFSVIVLNGLGISYIIKNRRSDSTSFNLEAPIVFRHSQVASEKLTMSSNAELVPSGSGTNRVYGVTTRGLSVFDDSTLQLIHTTTLSAGLDFSTSRYQIHVGDEQGKERIVVCAIRLLNFTTDTCGPKVYVFDDQAKLIAIRSLPGSFRTLVNGYEAIFSTDEFVLGQCSLADSDCENSMKTYFVPSIGGAGISSLFDLSVQFNSVSQTRDSNSSYPTLAISFENNVGALDLRSGFSTATEIVDHSRLELLGVISNDLETANWLLVQEISKSKSPQWIYVPTQRAP